MNVPGSSTPFVQLVLARLREFLREPAAIFWVYIFPILMMIVLGTAFRSKPVQDVKVVVERGPYSKKVMDALKTNEHVIAKELESAEARRLLRTNKTDTLIVAQSETEIEFVYDPTNPSAALARNTANEALQVAAGRKDPVTSKYVEVDEPGGRYIDFLVPGLLGIGLMGGGLWGVGFAIVDMRIRKLLKRFLATPMKRHHFLLAMMFSRFMFMVPEVLLLLLAAWAIFGVVIHGSIGVVVLLVMLGAFEFSGIGLLTASRAQTLETVSGLMNLVMLPMWLLSGVFFSYERFPEELHPLIQILPLTALIQALRSVMQEGATLSSLGFEIIVICVWGIVTFLLALKLFRWS